MVGHLSFFPNFRGSLFYAVVGYVSGFGYFHSRGALIARVMVFSTSFLGTAMACSVKAGVVFLIVMFSPSNFRGSF